MIKDLKDIRTIMLEAEQGKYKYVFALVADLKTIIQSCRVYLNVSGEGRKKCERIFIGFLFAVKSEWSFDGGCDQL